MRHFVYSMNGQGNAPATGGDTESWFFFYKWDTGGDAFVPFPLDVEGGEPVAGDLLWFVMDQKILGYAPVASIVEVSAMEGMEAHIEVHYDTQRIIGPGQKLDSERYALPTGMVTGDALARLIRLQERYVLDFPARPSSAPPPVPAPREPTAAELKLAEHASKRVS